jgi:tRNA uridine 5-carbamoylmethylation protein Kti12
LSVSKGSINRVNKIKQSNENTNPTEKIQKEVTLQVASKEKINIEEPKKINELHEEKFKVISRIKQDIPDYLL